MSTVPLIRRGKPARSRSLATQGRLVPASMQGEPSRSAKSPPAALANSGSPPMFSVPAGTGSALQWANVVSVPLTHQSLLPGYVAELPEMTVLTTVPPASA